MDSSILILTVGTLIFIGCAVWLVIEAHSGNDD